MIKMEPMSVFRNLHGHACARTHTHTRALTPAIIWVGIDAVAEHIPLSLRPSITLD